MGHFFEDGGFTMIPLVLLGFGLVAAGVLDAMRPSARLRGVVWSLGAAMGTGGLLSFVMGVRATLRNAQTLETADERLGILIAGTAEAANNLVLALVFLVLLALLGAVSALRSRAAGTNS